MRKVETKVLTGTRVHFVPEEGDEVSFHGVVLQFDGAEIVIHKHINAGFRDELGVRIDQAMGGGLRIRLVQK